MESSKKAWKEEYTRKGIPSSFRTDPTKSVVDFVKWLKNRKVLGGEAADIGCGKGRNSFYLASQGFTVTGIDLLEENVDLINSRTSAVKAYALDAADFWPIKEGTLDVVIDVFCYKHIIDKTRQTSYRKELWNAIKSNGYYFISLASENDGFYGPLLKNSSDLKNKLIVDPYAKIASFLYTIEDLKAEFADLFREVWSIEQTSISPMHGKEYSRSVLNAIFVKK